MEGLHNNPTGCGVSGTYAPGPDEEIDVSRMSRTREEGYFGGEIS